MQIWKITKKIQRERRQIKFDLERATCIRDMLTKKYNNKLIVGDIMNTMKELKAINRRQANPKYKERTNILEELEAKDEQSNK